MKSYLSIKQIITLKSKFGKDKWVLYNAAGIYLFKVNKRNPRPMCKTCAKLTIKTPERLHCHH